MSVWLLFPAAIVVLALGVFVLITYILAQVTAELREELRRFSVTAVASDELLRELKIVTEQVEKHYATIRQLGLGVSKASRQAT